MRRRPALFVCHFAGIRKVVSLLAALELREGGSLRLGEIIGMVCRASEPGKANNDSRTRLLVSVGLIFHRLLDLSAETVQFRRNG
jgi:hypothetical protein